MGFFKHDREEKKLREEGARSATAEILHAKTEGESSSIRALWADDDDLSTGWLYYRLKLRVMPEGAEPYEVTIHHRDHGLLLQGEELRVLIDPADPTKVVVDNSAQNQQPAGEKPAAPAPAYDADKAFAELEAKIEKLKDMHARGALSDEQFAAEQARAIDDV